MPRRFADVRFETYRPDPAYPSQAAALVAMEAFAVEVSGPPPVARRRWFRRADEVEGGRPARYLDGGFGVGKTHLLAALWHVVPHPKAYVSFAELTALIGLVGMEEAVQSFSGYRLLGIDEFELDDVANTLMAVTFLRALVDSGVKVATTSNSLPDRLGEGRFSAEDFEREIAAIAAHFDIIRVDGPDYRIDGGPNERGRTDGGRTDGGRTDARPTPMRSASQADLGGVQNGQAPRTTDQFDELLAHLRQVHPVQYGALLDGVAEVVLHGVRPIENQGSALLFVQLVDKLYEAEVGLSVTGCEVAAIFDPSYRQGGYRKKYGRAESRLSAMLAETAAPDRRSRLGWSPGDVTPPR